MWIGRYGAQHSHSDVLSASIVKRTAGAVERDNYKSGDVIVRVENGVTLKIPKLVPVSVKNDSK